MLKNNWLNKLPLAKKLSKSNALKQDCTVTGIVCSGITLLRSPESGFKDELAWLIHNCREHTDGYGAVYYHETDYDKHHYQLLGRLPHPEANHPTHHIIRQDSGNSQRAKLDAFAALACQKSGKVMMAYTRKIHHDNDLATSAPYTFTDISSQITYSMIHHGSVDKDQLLLRLPGYVEWLRTFHPQMLDKENFDDSHYLFMWLVRNICAHKGDVVSGLQQALIVIHNNALPGQINILFSDGTGIYAYTNDNSNHASSGIRMAYKISRNVHNICSYKVRSSKAQHQPDWTTLKEHSLYFFPTQGAMLVYVDIDIITTPVRKVQPSYQWAAFSLMAC